MATIFSIFFSSVLTKAAMTTNRGKNGKGENVNMATIVERRNERRRCHYSLVCVSFFYVCFHVFLGTFQKPWSSNVRESEQDQVDKYTKNKINLSVDECGKQDSNRDAE